MRRDLFDTSSVEGGRLFESSFESPIGRLFLIGDEINLYLAEFEGSRGLENERQVLSSKLEIQNGSCSLIEQAKEELDLYFQGKLKEFTTPKTVIGTPFQKLVWNALETIPFGQTRCYQELAKMVGKRGAVRACGNANGRNALSLFIPCHRVIRLGGALGGYGGQVWRKKWLLEHEKKFFLEKLKAGCIMRS